MRLIESIRVEKGKAHLLAYHQERVCKSLNYLGGTTQSIDVETIVGQCLSDATIDYDSIYKLRFEYDLLGVYNVTLTPYKQKDIRRLFLSTISSLDVYSYKWLNRSALLHPQINSTDEVLFTYQDYLTDTSYSNIVLETFSGERISPRRPLLRGLQRQYLLDQGEITLADLTRDDLLQCKCVHLINAMLPLGRLCLPPSLIAL